jgi:Tol biopolymer transport system component/predicted Ser/Thr protein kinase
LLNSGTKLGPYEVGAPIGAGGMGEVYRARDTRLERTVAIKILPQHLSDQHDAKERFEREARAISSLNHPNICQLYDVGEQDGISFLVMEYLEGETLGSRLSKGPLPLEHLFRIGAEIADGLDRAHRSGVVHRDLKPSNIMLTKSGAKLMDFGLAKAVTPVSAQSSGLTQTVASPNQPLTAQGTVVGTFQYMSPEQVEGKEADARSDIFALGAVLYEMATGKRAFEGKTTASVLAAVLERQPAPISSVQPMTPRVLDQLVRTCMAKDPDERWQTAHDVRLQLKQIGEAGSQAGIPAPVVGQRKRREKLAWGAAAVFAVVAIVAGGLAYVANDKQLPVLRVQISPPDKTQFNLTGDEAGPAEVSPDGRYLVFSANDGGRTQLYLRSLDSLSPQPLPGTEGATFPFWSPDSRSVGFFTPTKVKRIDIAGGQPTTLCDTNLGRGASWGSTGIIVFAPFYNAGIFQVSASGGAATPITKVDNVTATSHRWPTFLPDGKHFLYLAVNHNAASSPDTAVFLASLDGKENQLLLHTFSSVRYATGSLLFLRENTLVAQSFDPASGQLKGDPETLREDVQFDAGLWRSNFSVSDNGILAYASGAATNSQSLIWYDRSGKQLDAISDNIGFYDVELSPDEKKLAVTDGNAAAATIWVYDLASKLKTRLTFAGGTHRSPAWSPDGKQIAFTTNQQATIAVKPATGAADEKVLVSSSSSTSSFPEVDDWSRDGRYILFDQGSGNKQHVMVLPTYGDGKPFPYAGSSSSDEEAGVFSPDGRWVAYDSNETGRPEVYVAPFPWTGAKWQVSIDGGTWPRWRGDGKEIYFFEFASSQLMSAQVDGSGSTFLVGGTKPLFRLNLETLSRAYQPTRDGQRFVVISRNGGSSQPLTLVQNWTAELKKK